MIQDPPLGASVGLGELFPLLHLFLLIHHYLHTEIHQIIVCIPVSEQLKMAWQPC
jgi:hypothetical protein